MERKPESGCELKTLCDGRSGILLRVEVTRSADETSEMEHEAGQQHGTATTLRLVQPWFGTNRHVNGDSYFASVRTAEALWDHGLRFSGPVETATAGYPRSALCGIELCNRGQHDSLLSKS